MTPKYINLKEALSELRIDTALKRLTRDNKPAVREFLRDTCLSAELSFFTVIDATELADRKLYTFNRYRDDVALNIKPGFTEVNRPEDLADEYEPNDYFNANFRYSIPRGSAELQLTVEDAADALTGTSAQISTIYLNEFGNVHYELSQPLSRTAESIKIERAKLTHWARIIYLYFEEKIPKNVESSTSLATVKQWSKDRMKSSDTIADPVLEVYLRKMLSYGRLPLMHELNDAFGELYNGKKASDWPTLTLAPPCDVDDTRQSNFLTLAKAKERIKSIYLPKVFDQLNH